MRRFVPVLLGVLTVCAGSYALTRVQITGDVTHFLPEGTDPNMANAARAMASSDANRMITFSLKAETDEATLAATREFGGALSEAEGFDWVRFGPGEGLQQDFYELYFPRRLNFISDDPDVLDEFLSDDSLRERAQLLKTRLGQPTGTFVREIATKDPWMLFISHLDRIKAAQGDSLEVKEGVFFAAATPPGSGGHGIVLATTIESPFDSESQIPVQERVRVLTEQLTGEYPGLVVEQSGVHRLAIAAEESMRSDIQRVSLVGTLGTLLFLLLVFRSPRLLFLGTVPIGIGFFAGLTATWLAFGTIHGLTLAFGATLIGVAIDYVAHYLNHQVLVPRETPEETARLIAPGLFLGAFTTVLGLIGLAWTTFPGIREIAVFTSVGVLAAVFATRYILPPFMPKAPTPTRVHLWLADKIGSAFTWFSQAGPKLWLLPLALVLLAAFGATKVTFLDDLSALNSLDEDIRAEDERVRARVLRMGTGRFLLAVGHDLDEALEVNEALNLRLRTLAEQNEGFSYQSITPFLWSEALQQKNYELATQTDAWNQTQAALRAEEFVPEAFGEFEVALREPFDLLRLEDIQNTGTGALVAPFVLDVGERVGVVTFVSSGASVAGIAEDIPGAYWFDQRVFLADAYAGFRASTMQLMLVGLVLVFLLILGRYRSFRLSVAAFLPAALAAVGAVAIVATLGIPLTLIHVVTLLLVLSMGVDYGIFMVESRTHPEGQQPTVVSLVVACVSTVLSFGALAFSANPAMQAMGLTAAIGVALSLILAPVSWLLLAKSGRAAATEEPPPQP